MERITTLSAFKAFLRSHGVRYDSWGTGATKPIERLFYEYEVGEIEFTSTRSGELLRVVHRVQLLVFHQRKGATEYLVEDRQVFANGASRTRSQARSLSEKMMPHESPKRTVLRAIKEELGITGVDPRALLDRKPVKDKPKDSSSYPGLLTVHEGPSFAWYMPHRFYKERGYIERQSDKTTYFVWTPYKKGKTTRRR